VTLQQESYVKTTGNVALWNFWMRPYRIRVSTFPVSSRNFTSC